MSAVTYRSGRSTAFEDALRDEVERHLHLRGGSTANRLMVAKILFFTTWMVAGYVRLYSAQSFGEVALGYVIASSGSVLLVISVAHDASHHALFRRPAWNRVGRHAWVLIGTNHLLWDAKHDVHHRYANVVGLDHDISQTELLRMNPVDRYRWFHRYQRHYVFVVYLLFGLFAITLRDLMLYRGRPDPGEARAKHRLIAAILVVKIAYFGINLALPIAVVPVPAWQIATAFLGGVTLVGLYTISTLVVPHVNRRTVFRSTPIDCVVDSSWYVHCLEVTVDSSPGSRLMAWFTGGLNTHAIHHMFPGVCHIHYRQLTAVLERIADEHGVMYRHTSFRRLLADHFAFLAEVGSGPTPPAGDIQRRPIRPGLAGR